MFGNFLIKNAPLIQSKYIKLWTFLAFQSEYGFLRDREVGFNDPTHNVEILKKMELFAFSDEL